VQIVYLNDRRDGIRALTERIRAGDSGAWDLAVAKVDSWQGDFEAITTMDALPVDLVELLRGELDELVTLLEEGHAPAQAVPDATGLE
jgi:hypothetical protein